MEREEERNRAIGESSIVEDIFRYLTILSGYRWMIIIATAVAVVGSVGFAILSLRLPPEKSPLPNRYTSTAKLLVQEEAGGSGTDMLLASLGFDGGAGGRDIGQLALTVLTSNEVVDRLVEEFGIVERYAITESVRSNSRNIILGGAKLSYDRTIGILSVGYTSIDPQFSRDMVVRMVELLSEWFNSKGTTTLQRQKAVLEDKLQEVSARINMLESEIGEFQREHGVMEVRDFASKQQTMLGDLQYRLILKEMELQNYQQFSRIEDANLARLRRERDSLVQLIRQIEQGGGDFGDENAALSKDLPELVRQLNRMNRDLEIQSRIYQTLLQQYEVAKLDIGKETVFQILEYPEVPDKKSGPARSQLVAAIVGGTFAASVMLALVLNSIRSAMARLRERESVAVGRR